MNDELNIPIVASIQHAYGLQLMRFESVHTNRGRCVMQ